MKLTFIELPLFTSLVMQVTDDHFLNQLQNDLLKDPEKGDIIPRVQGLRKVRRLCRAGAGQAAHGSFTFIFHSTTRSFSFTVIPKPSWRTSPRIRRNG